MCGIIGIIGKAEATPLLIDGLKRLEYRGYDSAGIATLVEGRIDRQFTQRALRHTKTVLPDEHIGICNQI